MCAFSTLRNLKLGLRWTSPRGPARIRDVVEYFIQPAAQILCG